MDTVCFALYFAIYSFNIIPVTSISDPIIRMQQDETIDFLEKIKIDVQNKNEEVEFAFAKHFQDHMVLQQAPRRANVYGFSPDIGQKVILQLNVSSKELYYKTTVKTGPAPGVGVWTFTLDPITSSKPAHLIVQSERGQLTLKDVLFGDVWLCSGQSNMEFVVGQMFGGKKEIKDAHEYPDVRLMTVNRIQSNTPLYDIKSILEPWSVASKKSVGGKQWEYFSAVCWLYGKALNKALGYPIGMISTDWGGTPVEAWSSPDSLKSCGVEGDVPKSDEFMGIYSPQNNSVLWNAMVHPLLGMTIYGAIWYQGEADAAGTRMNHYNCTFPAMIRDWRIKFNDASFGETSNLFPFGFVQLAPNRPDPNVTVGFPDIRWHQTADYGNVPNPEMPATFMAVAIDLPDFNSTWGCIHPRDKTDVGERLALSGLNIAYGKKTFFQGPFPSYVLIAKHELVVVYDKKWNLQVRSNQGWEFLCGRTESSDPKWKKTDIIAHNETTVTLDLSVCGSSTKYEGIRYLWRESPCELKKCAIYSTVNELPAPPLIVYGQENLLTGLFEFNFGDKVLL